MKRPVTRRDYVGDVSDAVLALTDKEAVEAWRSLGRILDRLAHKDVPKFWDVLVAINAAAKVGRRKA